MRHGNAVTSSTLSADPPTKRNHRCILHQNGKEKNGGRKLRNGEETNLERKKGDRNCTHLFLYRSQGKMVRLTAKLSHQCPAFSASKGKIFVVWGNLSRDYVY